MINLLLLLSGLDIQRKKIIYYNCENFKIEFNQWRSKVGAGPCARISKGPPLPHAGFVCSSPPHTQQWGRVHCTPCTLYCYATEFFSVRVYRLSRLTWSRSWSDFHLSSAFRCSSAACRIRSRACSSSCCDVTSCDVIDSTRASFSLPRRRRSASSESV